MHTNLLMDSLTNLKTERALIEDYKESEQILICILDVNHFREINKTLGYDAGNYLLRELARILEEHHYICYRLGNDEFVIVSPNSAYPHEIEVFCNYLFELLIEETFLYNENEIIVTVSLGIAVSEKGTDSEAAVLDLIYNANSALKHAKKHNLIFSIYDEGLSENMGNVDNAIWKNKLLGSLKKKEVITYFQPIYCNNTNNIEKYEALMRIKDEAGNLISPDEFLRPSKKYRLYNHLTREVFKQVLDQILVHDCEISINISVRDIKEFLQRKYVVNRLSKFPKADKVVFELLETERVKDYEEVKIFIDQIKEFGCKVAIDDFGSGYSNFNHVMNLNVDYIKIDSSIIRHIDNDENAEKITKLIVDYAKTIKAKTIAEFVYCERVYEKVKCLGVDYSQGFYLGKPQERI